MAIATLSCLAMTTRDSHSRAHLGSACFQLVRRRSGQIRMFTTLRLSYCVWKHRTSMTNTQMKFGIPDIELPRAAGGVVRPAAFAGHALVVTFCPTAPESEAAELADYQKLASEMSRYDAWLITVSERPITFEPDTHRATAAAHDLDGSAWAAFQEVASPGTPLDQSAGATYLFGRGGTLQRIWVGAGHSAEVLEELAKG